jgi:hypothetical protein
MIDQHEAEAATYTINTRDNTSVPSAGFESIIPAIERPQTYGSDRTATEIGI